MVLGALALSYVQQLVANNQPLPNKVYLLSPMLDATLTNPEITEDLSNKDRFVNKDGLQRIFNVWTQGEALANPLISNLWTNTRFTTYRYIRWWQRNYHPDMKRFVYNLEEKDNQFNSLSIRKCSMISFIPIHESHKVIKQITKTIDA